MKEQPNYDKIIILTENECYNVYLGYGKLREVARVNPNLASSKVAFDLTYEQLEQVLKNQGNDFYSIDPIIIFEGETDQDKREEIEDLFNKIKAKNLEERI